MQDRGLLYWLNNCNISSLNTNYHIAVIKLWMRSATVVIRGKQKRMKARKPPPPGEGGGRT